MLFRSDQENTARRKREVSIDILIFATPLGLTSRRALAHRKQLVPHHLMSPFAYRAVLRIASTIACVSTDTRVSRMKGLKDMAGLKLRQAD